VKRFESIVVEQLRRTLPPDGLFGLGKAKIIRERCDREHYRLDYSNGATTGHGCIHRDTAERLVRQR
jgi:hypothetical protein